MIPDDNLGRVFKKSISEIVCHHIHQLLVDKYPSFEFQIRKGLHCAENKESYSYTIICSGLRTGNGIFLISVNGIILTVSKPTRIANFTNNSFELAVEMDDNCVSFDLMHPDSVDLLMTYVDQLTKSYTDIS
jgi:hypothetical protein